MITVVSSIVISALVVWFLLKPHLLLAGDSSIQAEDRDMNALQDERSRHLQVLHDLELDYATTKISEEDYQIGREEIMGELGEVIEAIDKLE